MIFVLRGLARCNIGRSRLTVDRKRPTSSLVQSGLATELSTLDLSSREHWTGWTLAGAGLATELATPDGEQRGTVVGTEVMGARTEVSELSN